MSIATYRNVFKNALRIFFIKLFPYVAILFVTILYSRNLAIADYGDYQDFWVKLLLIGTVAYAGIPVTILTYAPDVIKGLYRHLLKRHVHWFVIWMIACAAVFAFIEGHQMQLSYVVTGLLLMLYVVHSVQESLLMTARKMNVLILLNLLYGVYFIGIHMAVLDHYNLDYLLNLLLIGTLIRAIVLSAVVYHVYAQVSTLSPADGFAGKAGKLWLHLGVYDLMQNIFRYLDKFIISMVLSAPLYALYFNGAQDIPILPYLLGAVSGSVLLQLSENKQVQSSYILMRDASRLLSCIVFPLFFFLLFFRHELFLVVFTDRFADSAAVFAASIMVLPLRAYNYTVLLQHRHQGATINKGALLDIMIALLLIYPFYKLLGLPGVALSFVFSTYLQVGYYIYHIAKLEQVAWQKLFPLANWGWKFLSSAILFASLHLAVYKDKPSAFTLTAGAFLLVVYSSLMLLTEYKTIKS